MEDEDEDNYDHTEANFLVTNRKSSSQLIFNSKQKRMSTLGGNSGQTKKNKIVPTGVK